MKASILPVMPATTAAEVYILAAWVSTEALLVEPVRQEEHTAGALATTALNNYVLHCPGEDFHWAGQPDYCYVVGSKSYYSYIFIPLIYFRPVSRADTSHRYFFKRPALYDPFLKNESPGRIQGIAVHV